MKQSDSVLRSCLTECAFFPLDSCPLTALVSWLVAEKTKQCNLCYIWKTFRTKHGHSIGTVKKGVFKHLSKKGLNNSDGLEMKDKSVLASKYYAAISKYTTEKPHLYRKTFGSLMINTVLSSVTFYYAQWRRYFSLCMLCSVCTAPRMIKNKSYLLKSCC